MSWICSKCGHILRGDVVYPVRCVCGEKHLASIDSPFKRRMQLCVGCEQYGQHDRNGKLAEGCGLLNKPCLVDRVWTGKDLYPEGCPYDDS